MVEWDQVITGPDASYRIIGMVVSHRCDFRLEVPSKTLDDGVARTGVLPCFLVGDPSNLSTNSLIIEFERQPAGSFCLSNQAISVDD